MIAGVSGQVRVPNTGPVERERQELIRKLERDLRGLEAVPPRQRENELADVREDICRAMLRDLYAGRPLVAPRVEPLDLLQELLGGDNNTWVTRRRPEE